MANETVFNYDFLYDGDHTTREQYELLLKNSPYAREMSALDLELGRNYPGAGLEILLNKEIWHTADDEEVKARVSARNDNLRADYQSPGANVYLPASSEPTGNLYASGSGSASKQTDAGFAATQSSLPYASSAEEYLNALYKAQQEQNLSALKTAYDANVLSVRAARDQITPVYAAARNAAASDHEIEKQAFGEYAAARGLGEGAQAQARLSIDNAIYGELGAITREQSEKLAESAMKLAELEAKYKNDIAYEIAKGNYDKAKALYNDFVRVDDSYVDTMYKLYK